MLGFSILNTATGLLKIHLLFNDGNIVGDQVGIQVNGLCHYPFQFPDSEVDMIGVSVVSKAWQKTEGESGWNYQADIVPDRIVNIVGSICCVAES